MSSQHTYLAEQQLSPYYPRNPSQSPLFPLASANVTKLTLPYLILSYLTLPYLIVIQVGSDIRQVLHAMQMWRAKSQVMAYGELKNGMRRIEKDKVTLQSSHPSPHVSSSLSDPSSSTIHVPHYTPTIRILGSNSSSSLILPCPVLSYPYPVLCYPCSTMSCPCPELSCPCPYPAMSRPILTLTLLS